MTDESNSFAAWLAARPEITRVEAVLFDVNAAPKGKWLVRDKALGLAEKGMPMPLSVFALDAWGCDVAGAGLAFGTGDPDGLCHPVPGRWGRAPWLGAGSAQVMLGMADRDEDDLNALSRRTYPDLLEAALDGTKQAHYDAGRPTADINLPLITEHTIGQLMQMLMLATVVEGRLLGVNPYGQPGVEGYERNMNRILRES